MVKALLFVTGRSDNSVICIKADHVSAVSLHPSTAVVQIYTTGVDASLLR